MKKILLAVLPHFDKADTAFRVITVLYKVVVLLRDELVSIIDNKNPPTSGPAAMMVAA